MKMIYRIFIAVFFIVLVSVRVDGQKSLAKTEYGRYYQDGIALFDAEKYVAAQKAFSFFIDIETDRHSERYVNAVYYSAVCDLYLFHKNAEYNLEHFVLDYPNSHWNKTIYFELASYNYGRKKYKKALEWFALVDVRQLNAEQQLAYKFKRGHSAFDQGDMETARQDFFEVKDQVSEYQVPAKYYYAHIAYVQGDYQTALQGFEALKREADFQEIVPYYISQIYYFQKRYDQLLAYARPLLDSGEVKVVDRLPEIAHMVGDALYRKDDYSGALNYLEMYNSGVKHSELSREDHYQYGYCLYRTGQYQACLEAFSGATGEADLLGQSATYHMGDAYLKLDQKTYARNAFAEASSMDFDLKVKEDALFNYAKLSYELSYNPFHEAIKAFEVYLEEYPHSPRRDEAYGFLLNVYMNTKNYEAALHSLDKMVKKDAMAKEAYQLLAFNRGVELFNAHDYPGAAVRFKQVSTYDVNHELTAESFFWLGEIAFRQDDYTAALGFYNRFRDEPGAYNSSYYNEAHYGAGYALFMREKYLDAASAFRKYLQGSKIKTSKKYVDANLRVGDCYYVKKDFEKAISYYDAAIADGQYKLDYAVYQKALCLGLAGQNDKKVEVLRSFLIDYPESDYVADAKFGLANTYKAQDRYAEALVQYKGLIADYPTSPYVKKSWLDILLVYYKMDDAAKVVEVWDYMKGVYVNDPILTDAYQIAEPILIDKDLMSELPNILNKSQQEIDFKTFEAARDYALRGNCEQAINKLSAYLLRYDPAFYALEANYYLGGCYFEKGDTSLALNAFEYVVGQPVGDYTEESLVLAATINYNRNNFKKALADYQRLETLAVLKNNVLEAQVGIMRCAYLLGDDGVARKYADRVIEHGDTPDNIRRTAYLWRARMLMQEGSLNEAYQDFSFVNKQGGVKGAESKFYMAQIAYEKQAYKAAEEEVFGLIEAYAVYDEWKYKGFLLLADIYVGLEDYFQAKATLNAILENVSEPWVRSECEIKLQNINLLENPPESDIEEDAEQEISEDEINEDKE